MYTKGRLRGEMVPCCGKSYFKNTKSQQQINYGDSDLSCRVTTRDAFSRGVAAHAMPAVRSKLEVLNHNGIVI